MKRTINCASPHAFALGSVIVAPRHCRRKCRLLLSQGRSPEVRLNDAGQGIDIQQSLGVDRLKHIVKKTPIVRDLARMVMRWRTARSSSNFSSSDYWESRYREGRSSGAGSYNRLAILKAEMINRFVKDHKVQSVIEFGCGDGSQLRLAEYPHYIGVDVSPTVLQATRQAHEADPTKSFIHVDGVGPAQQSDLSLSLDVIYHLVEDPVFDRYMDQLFDSSRRYVIIYSSNDDRQSDSVHVRHRRFTDWIARNRPEFRQIGFVKNAYPESVQDIDNTSFADFYFFAREPEAIQP
jgi:SAM-dependent methyltransferase